MKNVFFIIVHTVVQINYITRKEFNVSDTLTWMKLKGIRRTGYNSHTDYQSMTGIQKRLWTHT